MKTMIVIALVLSGCGVAAPGFVEPVPVPVPGLTLPSTYEYTIKIDGTADKNGFAATDFLPQILVSGEHWSPFGAEFVVDDTSPRHIYCADWDMAPAVGVTNASGIALNCLYIVDNLTDDEDQVRFIEHEVGHAFGLSHVVEPLAVMAPYLRLGKGSALTEWDVQEFYRVHADDNRTMPTDYGMPVDDTHDGE